VESERAQAAARLRAGLASARWRSWTRAWRSLLQAPSEAAAHGPAIPLRTFAEEQLRAALGKTLERGRRVDSRSPARALHRLRLKVKRLRYLAEAFRGLYEEAAAARLLRSVKSLQDCLGAYQDLDVHARAVTAHARRLEREGAASPSLRQSARLLARTLGDRRRAVRAQFAERFAAFDRRATADWCAAQAPAD
jgi:CHAD domain-containing protein